MFKSLRSVLIISSVVYFINAAVDEILEPINENIPFVLIKVEDRVEVPREIRIKYNVLTKKKRLKFEYSNGKREAFYCPAETKDQRQKIDKANEIFRGKNNIGDEISQFCLFEKKKTKNMVTKFPQCEQPFQPKMMNDVMITQIGKWKKHSVANSILCGPSNLGRRLKFGYEICDDYGKLDKLKNNFNLISKKRPFKLIALTMYRVCYNAQKKKILYTLHQIRTPLLFEEDFLQKEVVKEPDEMATNELMNMSEIDFKEVKLKLEELQKSNKNPEFIIQLLVPLEDFPFLTWKIPVYHFVNASLINKELELCWIRIHDRIRKSVIKTQRLLSIYTRAFEYFETSSAKDGYVDDIQIPSIWVKLVHDMSFKEKERKAVAIIANNKRDDTLDQIIWAEYDCEQNLCLSYIESFFRDVARDIRCCRVTTKIQLLFGLNLTFKGVLDIKNLIDQVPDSSNQKSATKAPRKLQQITSG